uniref:Uncharacterized protein n=1 Tax=Hyaloperonospora arabidopsidis (strain Emoy2) TaxID=559515 RepID=M4BKA6_HYAAE
MERLLTRGCTTNECDDLACGLVVAPKAHHQNKSSGLGRGCPPNGQHPSDNEPMQMIGNAMILVRLENRT